MKRDFNQMFPDEREKYETEGNLKQAQYIMLRILKIVSTILDDNNITYWLIGGTLLGGIRHKGFIPWDDDMDIAILKDDYDKAMKALQENLPDDLFLQTLETDKDYIIPWIKVKDNNSYLKEYRPGNYHKGIFIDIFPMQYVLEDVEEVQRVRNQMNSLHALYTEIKEPFYKVESFQLFLKNVIRLVIKICTFPVVLMGKKRINKMIRNSCDKRSKKVEDKESGKLDYYIGSLYFTNRVDTETVFPLKKLPFEDFEFCVPNDWHRALTDQFGDYMQMPPESERICHNLEIIPQLNKNKVNERK